MFIAIIALGALALTFRPTTHVRWSIGTRIALGLTAVAAISALLFPHILYLRLAVLILTISSGVLLALNVGRGTD